jgi:hypothetical protein
MRDSRVSLGISSCQGQDGGQALARMVEELNSESVAKAACCYRDCSWVTQCLLIEDKILNI